MRIENVVNILYKFVKIFNSVNGIIYYVMFKCIISLLNTGYSIVVFWN